MLGKGWGNLVSLMVLWVGVKKSAMVYLIGVSMAAGLGHISTEAFPMGFGLSVYMLQ